MNFYKQCDSRWGSKKLGTCSDTICQSGCFLCCLSMLSNIPPDQANEMLKSGGYIQWLYYEHPRKQHNSWG
jgi:hypothetical protein